MQRSIRLVGVLALLFAATAVGQQPQPAASNTGTAQPHIRSYVSTHEGRFNGQSVKYTATAADTIVRNSQNEPAATIFSFSYTRNDVEDANRRPVIFVFNGGPGSSSIWLHMSGLGPKHIDFGPGPGANTAPPFAVADSGTSVLDAADLVFIDPVGTGFSHLLPGGKPEDYFGFNEDARSIAEFIRTWLVANGRWNSPRYILGESYGTMRAAALARELTGGYGGSGAARLGLNGLIMVGQAMAITQTNPDQDNDMSPPLYLPSMAATAWFHGKVDRNNRTFESFVEEARRFAAADYISALFAGQMLKQEERIPIARKLSRFTGVAEEVWMSYGLRMTRQQFAAELLRDKGLAVGLYDGRFTEPLPAGQAVESDPFQSQVTPPFVSAFLGYLGDDLGVTLPDNYNVSASFMSKWNWDTGAPGTARFYFDVAPLVAQAMRQNPQLRVLMCSGYYDLTTPFFSAEHTVSHSGMPLARVQFAYYHAGHMPYVGNDIAKKFAADVRDFVSAAQK